MALGRIRVETANKLESPHTKYWRIFLDEQDVSHFVRSINIHADVASDLPVIDLEIVGFVEFPDEIQALIKLYLMNPEIPEYAGR